MTPEQIRIAVAEEMDARPLCPVCNFDITQDLKKSFTARKCHECGYLLDSEVNYLPNYPADLNACHEMEKFLKTCAVHDVETYGHVLARLNHSEYWTLREFDCAHATPLQRCEAFLRVRNKWRDK